VSEVVYNRIAMLRVERGVSRRQLAEALGVHCQTIGYLERGEYSPSLYLALRIAEYFRDPGRGDLLDLPVPQARHRRGFRLSRLAGYANLPPLRTAELVGGWTVIGLRATSAASVPSFRARIWRSL